MHPYVYKKHHTPFQLLAVVILCIMILPQPTQQSLSCSNYPIKKIGIYSDFSKGFVRVEGNNVVAGRPSSDENNNYLFKVTIDKHYMLLYHIESKRFICWNKTFRKLIPKRNPTNLTHCKFEDKLSKVKDHQGWKVRYTSKGKGREVEMRFSKSGAFAKPKLIERCVKKHKLHQKFKSKIDFLKLNPENILDGSEEMNAYTSLMHDCANPDFLQKDTCISGSSEFCQRMNELITYGRTISPEIKKLCKNEWSKSN